MFPCSLYLNRFVAKTCQGISRVGFLQELEARFLSKIQFETAPLFVKFEIDDRKPGSSRLESDVPVSVSFAGETAIQDAPSSMQALEFRLDIFGKYRRDVILVLVRETCRRAQVESLGAQFFVSVLIIHGDPAKGPTAIRLGVRYHFRFLEVSG